MDDIVKRIRQQSYFGLEPYEAANEIEQLRQRVAELENERDALEAALNFARQGYQAASENGDHDEVEWAEMYLRSIDTAIASAKE